MAGTEVVHNKVFVLDVVGKINPVNVSVNISHLDLVADDSRMIELGRCLPGKEDISVCHCLNGWRVGRTRDISQNHPDRAGGLTQGVASNDAVESSIGGHSRVKGQVAPAILSVDHLQPGVIHEDQVILQPLHGSSWLTSNQARDAEGLAFCERKIHWLLPEEGSDAIDDLPRLGDLDLRFSLSQLCRLVGGEVIASPGLQASLPLGFNLLIHDVSESPPLLNDWALHILEL